MKVSLEAPTCDDAPLLASDSFLNVSHRIIHVIIGNFERIPLFCMYTIDIGFKQGSVSANSRFGLLVYITA